jgi:3-oxoacyl-[acyl-carrier protein] reductase
MQHLKDKVAIVTGSTGGIGLGIARKLAAEGAAVMVTGRDAEKGAAVVAELRAPGGTADFFAASVQSKDDMDALVDATVRRFGKVDVMVASAGGVASEETRSPRVRGIFNTLDIAAVAEVAAKATTAKLLPVHAVLPHMIGREAGSCVFVTSEGGRAPTAGQTTVALYAGGLVMATKVLAKEMARHKVRVNCIAVTLVAESPSWAGLEGQTPMTELHRTQYARIAERAPLGIARPADIGAVAAFLASDEAAFITGATVSPTGGLTFS